MVSDEWVEVGDNTNGVNHVIAAHICIRGNADDALLAQGIYGIAHDADGLEQSFTDNRLHDIKLQLACLSGHRYSLVISEDLKAHLIDYFRDNWVDLAWHDRGASLAWRQVDLP